MRRLYIYVRFLLAVLLLSNVLVNTPSMAAGCTSQALVTGTIHISTPASYALWLRYQATTDTSLQITVDGECYDVLLTKSSDAWTWTNRSTIGASMTHTFSTSKDYTVSFSGNDTIKIDEFALLAVGSVCTDNTSVPTGDGLNCANHPAIPEATTPPPSAPSQMPGMTMPLDQPVLSPTSDTGSTKPGATTPQLAFSSPTVSGTQILPVVSVEAKQTASQVSYFVDSKLVATTKPEETAKLDTSLFEDGKHTLSTVVIEPNGMSMSTNSTFESQNNTSLTSTVRGFIARHKTLLTVSGGSLGFLTATYILFNLYRSMHLKRRQLRMRGFETVLLPTDAGRFFMTSAPLTAVVVMVLVLSAGTVFAAVSNSTKNDYIRLALEDLTLSQTAKKTPDPSANDGTYVAFSTPVTPQSPVSTTPGAGASTPTLPSTPSPTPTTPVVPVTGGLIPQFGAYPIIASNFNTGQYISSGGTIPRDVSSEPSGNFRFICAFSHLAYDDPIVYPGKLGVSHLHMFFGNTKSNANSTFESLRQDGDGSCQGGPLNRSAYWAPAVINGSGKAVLPVYITIYYKGENGTVDFIKSTVPIPRGLKMIAGFNPANPATDPHFSWHCEQGQVNSQSVPSCPSNEKVGVRLAFPQCWNGHDLDSADHRSHLAYLIFGDGPAHCPSSHPVHIPEFTLGVWFLNDGATQSWKLSSDTVAYPNGQTFHSDWFGAWDEDIMNRWLTNCVHGLRDCSGGQLGDGSTMNGAGFLSSNGAYAGYTGPWVVDVPAKP